VAIYFEFSHKEQTMQHLKESKHDVQSDCESCVNLNNRSTYCDYNKAFAVYDRIRQPPGLQTILNILQQSAVPLDGQIILEGGFGTGAYLDRVRHHVKMIYGVEGSDQGYRQTRKKVGKAANVNIQIGNILKLSFADNFFHGYLVNQVLHHLDRENNFQQIDAFLSESYRVLKSGGHLVINTCSQVQLDPEQSPYWHYEYIPKAAQTMQLQFIPIAELEARLKSAGFGEIQRNVPSGTIFQQEYYENPRIALQPEFRQGDSTYSFITADEIVASNHRLNKAIEDGSVYRVMRRAAERAAEIGEILFISARKS
jgi:ubiquinone/menaquinone biosynthesis C-methylase UbiE